VQQQIRSYLSKVQLQALQKAEKLMASDEPMTLPQLIACAKDLAELQALTSWLPKLEKAILKGKAPLLPPGISRFPALKKMGQLAKGMKQAAGGETPAWAGDLPE
jgi:hypothetical protein